MLIRYRTVDGDMIDTFKRGADSFPQIDRDCFVIEGGNLQRFMGILVGTSPTGSTASYLWTVLQTANPAIGE